MRLERAIDRYLAQMQVEGDWTPRTIDSVYRFLVKLADYYPEHRLADFESRAGTDMIRSFLAHNCGRLSSTTRATRISYLHSFFAWAEQEGLVDDDPSRRIKRPPKRRADVYRPTATELQLGERAAQLHELAPWALMARRGLRAATVCALRWQDFDLQRGRVSVQVKGGHRDSIPLGPAATQILQRVYRALEPDPGDHVFAPELERWVSQDRRVRTLRDPKVESSTKTLWAMVRRVCERAGIRPLGPHALRHGFANQFLRDSNRDVVSLQKLMGHAQIETTKKYVNELELQELEDVLEAVAQASSEKATSEPPEVREPASGSLEAAGIEPASAPSRSEDASESDSDDPPLAPGSANKGGHKHGR